MVMFSSTRKKRYAKKEKIGYNEVAYESGKRGLALRVQTPEMACTI